MTLMDFLSSFGFEDNPFRSTNAGDEPRLTSYFVHPPYFAAVLGDPDNPRGDVVLAPRGGGKTAQRIKIESESQDDGGFLCVTYDQFDTPQGFSLDQADLIYHLRNISRLLLVAALSQIENDPCLAESLSEKQKAILKFQVKELLGDISSEDYQQAISSIKNMRDKASDVWDKYGGKVAAVINAFTEKYGFGSIEADSFNSDDLRQDKSFRFHFSELVNILICLGFKSVYVLVDRVDEIAITSRDARSSFNFIRSLLEDLLVLETRGVAFKFFLWDQMSDLYKDSGARPDRVPLHTLRWSHLELEEMLSERLKAYSDGAVEKLDRMVDSKIDYNVHALVCRLANGSPRDMIRICQQIINDQTRVSTDSDVIKAESLWRGIKAFSDTRSDELYGPALRDLRKIGSPTFTINMLASEVFRTSTQAARAKVQKWVDSGAVAKIGEIPNPPNRPLHLYGLVDPRLGICLRPSQETELILGNVILECPSCSALCLSDRDEIECLNCFDKFNLEKARSVLGSCVN